MPDPALNIVVILGKVVARPIMGYVGRAHTARVRFTLTQRRLFRRLDGSRGREDIALDCEIWGRQAEVFASTIGAGSLMCVHGHMRTYTTRGARKRRFPFVVADMWTVLRAEAPHRFARRAERSAHAAIKELDLPVDDLDVLRVQT